MPKGVYVKNPEHLAKLKTYGFQKGFISWAKGKKFTPNHCANISKAKIGCIGWNKGKHLSLEHRRKVSLNHADVSGANNPRYIDGKSLKKHYCSICKKPLSEYRAKKCSVCSKLGNKNSPIGEKSWNWQGGKSIKYPLGWTHTFKEQIRQRDDYKCQVCGVPEVECINRLSVHHIDYDKNNLNKENLISLCVSCHTKTQKNRKGWVVFFTNQKEEV